MSLAILLAVTFASFVYLFVQTQAIVCAKQLESIKESVPFRKFVTRRVPLLFVPVFLVLPSIVFGVSDLISPSSNTLTPFFLIMGTVLALQGGIAYRDGARMIWAGL